MGNVSNKYPDNDWLEKGNLSGWMNVYHGTSPANLASIFEKGLLPGTKAISNVKGGRCGEIWSTTNLLIALGGYAKEWAFQRKSYRTVLIARAKLSGAMDRGQQIFTFQDSA